MMDMTESGGVGIISCKPLEGSEDGVTLRKSMEGVGAGGVPLCESKEKGDDHVVQLSTCLWYSVCLASLVYFCPKVSLSRLYQHSSQCFPVCLSSWLSKKLYLPSIVFSSQRVSNP